MNILRRMHMVRKGMTLVKKCIQPPLLCTRNLTLPANKMAEVIPISDMDKLIPFNFEIHEPGHKTYSANFCASLNKDEELTAMVRLGW
jgi:hypothetical protein